MTRTTARETDNRDMGVIEECLRAEVGALKADRAQLLKLIDDLRADIAETERHLAKSVTV